MGIKKTQIKPRFPGDLTIKQQLEQMIRVNQAGEYGAKRIYQGQMDVLKGKKCFSAIKHMAEQEEKHLAYFNDELVKRNIRPSALAPLWHVAGYALGKVTAKMGEEAAMACTTAVEEVIDDHYQEQLALLGGEDYADETQLKESISKFREEELEHRDTAYEHNAKNAPAFPVLTGAIKLGSRVAIALAKRV